MGANGRLATLEGQVTQLEEELSRYQKAISQGVDPSAWADPMNGCHGKLAEARSAWNQVKSSSLADFECTDELVEEVIQAARRRLMGESSEETKHYLREPVHSVEVVLEDVAIRYAFNSTDTKLAYQLAPRAGSHQNPTFSLGDPGGFSVRSHQQDSWEELTPQTAPWDSIMSSLYAR